ncbi:hypothetical protein [Micromonospora sp. NPDC002717]|uniref:hypothetical protein n=1 Tax=Micromonospora sp. NPDC002717 TaxID=3154424 RepID=UPI0033170899
MAERFSLDPEGMRQLSRGLDAVRSEAAATWQRPDAPGFAGSDAVAESLQRFADAAARSHHDLDESLRRLARWLDRAADGQVSLDEMLNRQAIPDHTSRRSDT